jgi:hypothetical protein
MAIRGYCRKLSPLKIFKRQHQEPYLLICCSFFLIQIFVGVGAIFVKFSKFISISFFSKYFQTMMKLKKSYNQSLDLLLAN